MKEVRAVFDPAQVSVDWWTDVLGVRVVGFESEEIGTGQVGYNIRYRLRYDGSAPASAPSSVVAKFAARDETSRITGVLTRTYETEVAFYRELAATVDVSRPACYFAAIEPGTADVVLVLEDLAPAVAGDQLAGCTLAQAELAMDEAACLHGPRWGDLTLFDHPWLVEGPDGAAGVADLYRSMWPGFAERYRATLGDTAMAVGLRLAERIGHWVTYEPSARTVTHGDFRLDNMLFGTTGGGRPLSIVDWQTVRLRCGTADVAYFLGAGLDPVDRRTHEHDLVARYHRDLLAYGVDDYPFDACWEDYRRYSFGGYVMAVIASMLVGRTDRGDAMFMAMANRHAAQVADLDADQLL